MRSVPPVARVYVLLVVGGALVCAAPAAFSDTSWSAVALLACVYAGCEQAGRCRLVGRRAPKGMGTFFPVLLAGAFLLPAPAAALVAVPGALLARVEQRPAGLRRSWRAAQLALGIWAAAQAFGA
ncbi:metal-dependent phosphohydrolase, partial [Streptomyces kunmingensis]|nr:metal-dependent phosphohydrolase [Streptomyces kunmingensis]